MTKKEYIANAARLASAGEALMSGIIDSLVDDREADIELWRPLAKSYQELISAKKANSYSDMPSHSHATGQFAQIMTASDVESGIELATRIPENPDFDRALSLSEAVLAKRRIETNSPDQPERHADFAWTRR